MLETSTIRRFIPESKLILLIHTVKFQVIIAEETLSIVKFNVVIENDEVTFNVTIENEKINHQI